MSYEIVSVDAPMLKARVEGGPVFDWFRMRDQPHVVRLEIPMEGSGEEAFQTYGEGWVRVRDFVGENVAPDEYDWSYEGRTISFYFTDQLTAAKVRLLA